MGLETKAMLFRVSIVNQFYNKVRDKEISQDVARAHEAVESNDLYYRVPFSKKYMKNIVNAVNGVYAAHRKNSIPWGDDLYRLVASDHYMKWAMALREARNTLTEAVENFADHVELMKAQMRPVRKGLFHEEDYPTAEEIRGSFVVYLSPRPVPLSGDLRVDLPRKELDELRATLDEEYSQRLGGITPHLCDRLIQPLNRLWNVFDDPTRRFYPSVLDDLDQAVLLVSAVVFAPTSKLAEVLPKIRELRAKLSVEFIRGNREFIRAYTRETGELLNELRQIAKGEG